MTDLYEVPEPPVPSHEEIENAYVQRMTDSKAFRVTKGPSVDLDLPEEFRSPRSAK